MPFQPTNNTPFRGALNSYNLTTDVTDRGTIFGMDALSFVGLFYNYLDNQSYTFNKTPSGRNGLGALTQLVQGDVRNAGGRAREELQLTSGLRLIAGIGGEYSKIKQRQTNYTYPVAASPTLTLIPADREFWNVAPEASLLWQVDEAVRLHARVGTGYGIPQAGNLFVTSAGVFGNNTNLKKQSNVGADIGAEVELGAGFKAELTGYYEWFDNELVSQSAGVNLLAYTSNVPKSVHRGIELGVAWAPLTEALPGLRLEISYAYNDHYYTRFTERLTSGAVSTVFDRNGNKIPGVIPNFVNGRAGYEQPDGPMAGFGGFVEVTFRDGYFIDNGNLLTIPSYTVANFNLHYDPPEGSGWLSKYSFFAALQNAFDKTYIGSASIIADSLNPATMMQNPATVLANTTGSIYAGVPRTFYAGIKRRF